MIVLNILLYYLIIIPLSLLPFRVLYWISDGLFFLFFHVSGYRKKVVLQNIRNSFPEKSEKEHIEICRKFYKHLCDVMVESLKTFTISKKEILKRIVCNNPEVVNKFYDRKQSIIIVGGHYNNWELFAVSIGLLFKHKGGGIYQPLTNKYFEEKMLSSRGKYGTNLVPVKKVKQFFEDNKNIPIAPIFATDQSPSNPNTAYWMKFLNQDTGVLFGAEKFAKEYNFPVVYCRMNKIRRGFYTLDFFDVTDTPKETAFGEITEKATHLLEKDILTAPEFWLWSHRRWKHKRPEGK